MPLPGLAFVHLGAHKTGTTLLQAVFAAEAPRLSQAGIAVLPRDPFRSAISYRMGRWRAMRSAGAGQMAAAIQPLLPQEGPPPRALFVSDETLMGHLRTDLGNAPDRFYEHCGEVMPLLKRAFGPERLVAFLFIRRLDEFLTAAYLQLVRLGETLSFAEYLAGLDLERLSWLPTVRELAAGLGGPADRLVVYDHALLAAAPEALLADLFGRMGVAPPPASVLARRVNASPGDTRYRALLALNRAWPAERLPALRRVAAAAVDLRRLRGAGPARLMDPHLAARLAARHREELSAVAAMGGKVELALRAP
jgi:hypothetical protein